MTRSRAAGESRVFTHHRQVPPTPHSPSEAVVAALRREFHRNRRPRARCLRGQQPRGGAATAGSHRDPCGEDRRQQDDAHEHLQAHTGGITRVGRRRARAAEATLATALLAVTMTMLARHREQGPRGHAAERGGGRGGGAREQARGRGGGGGRRGRLAFGAGRVLDPIRLEAAEAAVLAPLARLPRRANPQSRPPQRI